MSQVKQTQTLTRFTVQLSQLCVILSLCSVAYGQSIQYGSATELKGVTKIFIDSGADMKAHDQLAREIQKRVPSITLADSIDAAEVVLSFEQEDVPFQVKGTTGKPNLAGNCVAWKPASNGRRVLWSFKTLKDTVFEDKPPLRIAKEFVKVYQKANK